MCSLVRSVVFVALLLFSTQAFASVRVSIDIGSQRMHVYVNGALRHVWKVSTGRGRYRTPTGPIDHSA